jgi:CRISPR system Cascade subunit CasB
MAAPSPGSAALQWWRYLQPYDQMGMPNPTSDRAALARLRRAVTPIEIMGERRVLDLYRRLGYTRAEAERWLPWVAVVAMVLSHVRKHDSDPRRNPPRAIGPEAGDEKGETASMKPARFRRLLLAREPADVAREMRRLVDLAGHNLDVAKIASTLLDWDDPVRGDRIRTMWAYDYYNAGDAAPSSQSDVALSAV